MARYFLRKSQRIVSSDDFRRVIESKRFLCKGILRLYVAANQSRIPRFGVTIGKSCGNAVQRNRLKRMAREVFRLHQHEIPAGYDYVLIFIQKVSKTDKRADLSGKVNEADSLQYKDVESRVLGMIEVLRQKGGLKESI